MAAGPAAGAGILEGLLDKLGIDLIKSLSPTEGLQVTPHIFQAIEQEGRWKPKDEFSPGRDLFKNSEDKNPPSEKHYLRNAAIVSIEMGETSRKTNPESTPFDLMGKLGRIKQKIVPNALRGAEGIPSSATIDAKWWEDGLEIWAGYAGLRDALGFGSLFGHQASIVLDGLPFGNHFPMSYFLAFSGYLNAVGPEFEEFRGAVVLKTNGEVQPLFCQRWSRDDPKGAEDVNNYTKKNGYLLKLGEF